MFLVNSRLSHFSAPPSKEGPLIPKLRGQFAEFLSHDSLEHLRILSSPTCVGLRYGLATPGEAKLFLGVRLPQLSSRPKTQRTVRFGTAKLLTQPYTYTLKPAIPSAGVRVTAPSLLFKCYQVLEY